MSRYVRVIAIAIATVIGAQVAMAVFAAPDELLVAAKSGNLDGVKALLDAKADANKSVTSDGYTPLIVASHNGFADVVRVLLAETHPDVEKAAPVHEGSQPAADVVDVTGRIADMPELPVYNGRATPSR